MKKHTIYRLYSPYPARKRRIGLLACAIAGICILGLLFVLQTRLIDQQASDSAAGMQPGANRNGQSTQAGQTEAYSTQVKANHQSVQATVFWAGEDATEDNRFITNRASAWVSDWPGSFGGVDAPDPRCGPATASLPCGFTPRENTFYFALPFNDYTADGKLQAEEVLQRIPWYAIEGKPMPNQSLIKNRWIEVSYAGKTAYAQWEDVGPFSENDIEYVFGSKPPLAGIGLDLSPATADYLGIDGRANVSWRFVSEASVPEGPWRTIITRGGLNFR